MDNDASYNKILKKVASNIKQLRNDKGLTQEMMADYGFNYRHFQKIESGKHSLSLYTLYRLSKVFKVKIIDLLK